ISRSVVRGDQDTDSHERGCRLLEHCPQFRHRPTSRIRSHCHPDARNSPPTPALPGCQPLLAATAAGVEPTTITAGLEAISSAMSAGESSGAPSAKRDLRLVF